MATDKNPKRTAHREARQRRRLSPGAVCIGCGESAPVALEAHHPMGRAHQPELTAPVCKNCHAKATEGQLREEVPLSATDNILDRLAAILGGVAAFFQFLADSFRQLAEQVKESIGCLDAQVPEWRAALNEGS